ncbi:MAG: hypothetical protein QM754_05875 [Tepidisphaeraceae bacterium]
MLSAGDVDFARTGHEGFAHLAHPGAGVAAPVRLQAGPALDGGAVQAVVEDEIVQHDGQLRHENLLVAGHFGGRHVGMRFGDVRLHAAVGVTEFLGLAEDFREVGGVNADAVPFEDFFAVANSLERARPGTDRAEAGPPQSRHRPARGHELGEVDFEARVFQRVNDVLLRQREFDAGLVQVVANTDFATERIPATLDAEQVQVVGVCLDENRHVEFAELEDIGDAALVAEVRQDDDDAVDLVAVFIEQVCALLRIGERFDTAELGLLRREHDGLDTELGEELFDVFAGLADEHIGEEISVTDDDAESGLGSGHGSIKIAQIFRDETNGGHEKRGRRSAIFLRES